MNNYELHSRAQELAASHSGYNLARRFLALEEELAEARRELGQSQQAQREAAECEVDDVVSWADGVQGCPEEFRGAVTEREWRISDAVLKADKGASPAPAAVPEATKERVRDAIAEAIGLDAYDCIRVWSAWSIGTMGPDDFAPIVDDEDRLSEIVDAAISSIAPAPAEPDRPGPSSTSCDDQFTPHPDDEA